MNSIFNEQDREDEEVVQNFFRLLPLIYSILYDEPPANSDVKSVLALSEGMRRRYWIDKLLELKRNEKELNINTLKILDPKKRSPHVQRLIKKKNKED